MFENMFILAVISQKGGPGKTTFSLNLATEAARQGHTAVIIDLDPQTNAQNWKDRRKSDTPAVTYAPASRLRQTLEAAQHGGATFVVLDSPGKADNIAIAAANYADLVLVPMETRMSNFETIPGVLGLIQATDGTIRKDLGYESPAPPAFIVLNKLHPSATTQAEKLKEMVAKAWPQIPICPQHLTWLDIYGTSQDTGKSVFDDDPKDRAALEIRQLYSFTISQSDKLDKSHVRQTAKSAKRA